jgi:hypothetical protein
MKKKFEKLYAQAWANLNAYCTSLYEHGKAHPYNLVLEERQVIAA